MQSNPGVNLTVSDFPDSQRSFEKLGLSFPGVIKVLNTNIELGKQQNNSDMANGSWLQQSLNLVERVLEVGGCPIYSHRQYLLAALQQFNAEPDSRSLLWAKWQIFVTSAPGNTTQVNMANWWEVYDGMIKSRGSSITWFYPVAVGLYFV
jgi:hypothetical protein